jgi:glycosyltransferase involved in cell wall biosynthesis
MADLVGFPRNRIQVIANGVNTDYFCPRPGSRAEVRRQCGLPQKGLVVGMVARLVPVKNHEGVLRAIADLAQQGKSITLAIAGDGPLLGELRSIATDLELNSQVHFLGDLDNVHQFLNALDIFVLNSHSEGMSNTILEAMSCGLPVVATSVGANSDLVVEGQTGLLIPPDDPPALANAIAKLVDNESLRLRMGEDGRARIEREFGIARMVRDYSQLYCELLGERMSTVYATHDSAQPDISHDLDPRSTRYRSTP